MKLHARSVAWLLPFFLTACFTKPHRQPAQEFAPPVANMPKPPTAHPQLPLEALTLPSEPLDTDADDILDEAAKPAVRHRRPVSKTAQDVPDPAPAAETESPGVSAIGQLSREILRTCGARPMSRLRQPSAV